MSAFIVNGEAWGIVRVKSGDPRLIDRTNHYRLATTDPITKNIYIDVNVTPPLLDRVLLHEVAHAITISYGIIDNLHIILPSYLWTTVEEIIAQIVENFSIEAVIITSGSLSRPICINDYCLGGDIDANG